MSELNWAAVANLPSDVIVGQGALFHDYLSHFGTNRGGLRFNANTERENLPYDGKKAPVAELDWDRFTDPKITGTFLQFISRIGTFEPGSVSAAGSGNVTTIYTPKVSGELYEAGDYITQLCWTMPRLSGGFFRYRFPSAIVETYDIVQDDRNALLINATFGARLPLADAAATPGKKPYVMEVLSSFS